MRKFLAILLCLIVLSPRAKAAENKKYVALTFDDGPSGKITEHLLEGLAQRNARATFLLCGYRIKQFPDLPRQILEAGHEIGLHGYSHNNMKAMSRREIARELMDTEALLPENCKIAFLRPPGGAYSDGVRQVAAARQYAVLGWSVDPRDWATRDTAAISTAVTGKVQDGDIVLLHDMSRSSVTAALEIVDTLQQEGFTFVTVSELAKIRDVDMKPGKFYERFPPEA